MKPGVPKGTRDFTPLQVNRRNYIFDTIRHVFVQFGYQPIETPAMENLSTLTGKYGDEGDQLLFKVLNNGDFLRKADHQALQSGDSAALIPSISKRGLRYDLTVPFARFVVMHQNDLALPFKRYQIQPVWRADRPQKSRYQEFYQCDVDVVGSDSLMYEAELVQIYDLVFHHLKLPVTIKINNRKILAGIAEVAGIADQFAEMTVAIDKLDKVGMPGVREELDKRGIPQPAVAQIEEMLGAKNLDDLRPFFSESEIGQVGIQELETFRRYFAAYTPSNTVQIEFTLARGLHYYTGCIFEVKAEGVAIGSIGGGGRYDDLTGVFGLKGTSGVGISFGADRIYDCLEALNLFPDETVDRLQVLLVTFDDASHLYGFQCLQKMREAGIRAELYPDPVKMKKQMKYANDRQAAYVVIIGSQEMETGRLAFKNMATGEQTEKELDEIMAFLTSAPAKPRN